MPYPTRPQQEAYYSVGLLLFIRIIHNITDLQVITPVDVIINVVMLLDALKTQFFTHKKDDMQAEYFLPIK